MASALTNLPAPGSAGAKKADRKAAFIRDAALAIFPHELATTYKYKEAAEQSVRSAEALAAELEKNGYL
jgi:hypothetical protein